MKTFGRKGATEINMATVSNDTKPKVDPFSFDLSEDARMEPQPMRKFNLPKRVVAVVEKVCLKTPYNLNIIHHFPGVLCERKNIEYIIKWK